MNYYIDYNEKQRSFHVYADWNEPKTTDWKPLATIRVNSRALDTFIDRMHRKYGERLPGYLAVVEEFQNYLKGVSK